MSIIRRITKNLIIKLDHLSRSDQILIIFLLIYININLLWIILDKAPQHWDPAQHMQLSFRFYNFFTGNSTESILAISPYYPPLPHIIVSLLSLPVGKNMDFVSLLITLWLIPLTHFLKEYLSIFVKNQKIVTITIILFYLAPSTFAFSRQFWLEIPFLTFLLAALLFMYRSEKFTNKYYSILFTIAIACVQYTRLTGFLYLAPPVAAYVFSNLNLKKLHTYIRLLTVSLPAIIVALPWYLYNWDRLIEFSKFFLNYYPDQPTVFLSVANFSYNIEILINSYLGWLGFLFSIIGAIFYYKKNRKSFFHTSIILLTTFLIFTYITNKDPKYLFPIVIYLYLYLSYFFFEGLIKINKYLGHIVLTLTLLFYILYMFIITFGFLIDPNKSNINIEWNPPYIGRILLFQVSSESKWLSPKYNDEYWPINEITHDFNTYCSKERRQVLMLSNKYNLNPINLEATFLEANYSCPIVSFPGGIIKEMEPDRLLNYLSWYRIALIPKNNLGSDIMPEMPFVLQLKQTIEQGVENGTSKIVKQYPLPDGDTLIMYELYFAPILESE